MHDLKFIVNETESFKQNIGKRGFDLSVVDEILKLDSQRKELIQFVEAKRAEIKSTSKEIGQLKKEGKDASEIMQKVTNLKSDIGEKDTELSEIEKRQKYLISIIPNLLDDEVPVGKDEEDNKEVKKWGEPQSFSFTPKDHADLGEELGMLDFERGAKITGSRFVVYKKGLARLERALINFMLDSHTSEGYEEIIPPFLINSESMFGTGQLPKFGEDSFKIEDKDRQWYLAATAEIPLTNMKRDELFPMDELPIHYCAYTPCFRSEAGSYGKDTRGLIRLHQFNKVEMVNIVAADKSEQAHEAMRARAEFVLEALKLPYRTMLLCSGDIGFGARKCYDLEVWLPGQGKYREISSVSNCWDFQSRRASIRYRDAEGKPQFAHTLNGSGLAVGRTVVAIMENYQQEDGSIKVPEVLKSYMGGLEVIKA